ncbi:glucose-1-phosphate adenylyltransferase subunit GlgD [Clostridium sp. SYSU_GA19001]|uniref:glucose-1-phosphate adenylyltransferase subunit GlgD n=1 Tax=Clostridium caldaquaticum TaxID=2940653 RepID=UPI0020779C07|nr:glucose-1-phosphate adenylyltransferase subunit GlgD [Clostridium caldaquaticum]MCM8710198.1 glucose-1-phosphate adenylyltransferase subunit GlgD [Clostridium caldaquaticum]
MLKDYMGILMLNENEDRIRRLTKTRPLASIPFGGRYRIIDFVLSNMVNSGITNIGIFTDGKTRSLMDHIGSGKPWDLDRKINGLFVFNLGDPNYYMSEINALKNNLEYFYKSKEKYVLFSPSYMVCNIDYKAAASYHEASGADITVIYKNIEDSKKSFINCDVLNLDKNNRVLSVGKNIGINSAGNLSMEMFLMKKERFVDLILECIKTGYYSSIEEVIYKNVSEFNVNAYEFKGYLSCINSINAYYKSNMDLLDLNINKELFFANGPIFTKSQDESPTKYSENCKVSHSLIANGCIIKGSVDNSIIFRRVKIDEGVEIKNCIIMQNCHIKAGAKLTNIIIDKNIVIEEGKELKGDLDIPLVVEKKAIFE